MQVFLLNTLTTWQFLLYLTLLMTVMATLIFILTKRLVHVSFHKHNKELFTLAISIIIANYGFLLGFIIIYLWQDIGHAMTLVSEEAAQLSIIVSDCFAFSSDFQHQFLNAVGQYIKYVVHDEWETMRWGNSSLLAQNAMQNIYHVVQSYTPQGKKEEIFYLELISHLDLVLENRRLRLDAVSSILIGPLRFIMVLGAIFIVFFISLLEITTGRLLAAA